MITFEIDNDKVMSTMTTMVRELEATRMTYVPDTYLDWQVSDMNRTKVNMSQTSSNSYASRLWSRVGRARTRTGRRSRTRFGPILRPAMFVKLCVRMHDMMQDKLRWR